MVDKTAFLKAYNIDEDDFKAADISWEELAAIYDDYLSKRRKTPGDRQKTLSMIISMILSGRNSFLPIPYQKSGTSFGEDHTKTERRSGEIQRS